MKTVFAVLAVLVCACSGSGGHPAGSQSGSGGSGAKHLHIPGKNDNEVDTLKPLGGHAGQTGISELADGGADVLSDAAVADAAVADADAADGGLPDAPDGSGGNVASGSGGAGAAGMGGTAGMGGSAGMAGAGGSTGALVPCSVADTKSNGSPMWPNLGPYCTKLHPKPDIFDGKYHLYEAQCCLDGFVGCDEDGDGVPPAGGPTFNCVHECGLNDPSCS